MSKIALGIAKGIAEFDGVGATGCRCDGDDDHLLYGGVHHSAVDQTSHAIVDRNVHETEVLVEADVYGVVTGSGYDGVGAYTVHQSALEIYFFIPLRRISNLPFISIKGR